MRSKMSGETSQIDLLFVFGFCESEPNSLKRMWRIRPESLATRISVLRGV